MTKYLIILYGVSFFSKFCIIGHKDSQFWGLSHVLKMLNKNPENFETVTCSFYAKHLVILVFCKNLFEAQKCITMYICYVSDTNNVAFELCNILLQC